MSPVAAKSPIDTSLISDKPQKLPPLDVTLDKLSMLDRIGPLTSTTGSAFLVSPVIGATLLTSAARLAKGAEPPALSPSTPIVWHPVSITQSLGQLSQEVNAQQPKHVKVFFEGQIRPVAVAAFEDLLFLTRIAKWKVAYHEGKKFNRAEQLPYCESNPLFTPCPPPHTIHTQRFSALIDTPVWHNDMS